MKRCLPISIYEWLGKLQLNFITEKIRVLQSPKHGRYYECRLQARKKHATVSKDFKIKSLGKHHDLYVQSNTLLSADVFENFQKMYLEIYELGPGRYCTWISMVSSLKKDQSKMRSFTWYRYVINDRKRDQRWGMSRKDYYKDKKS